MNLDREIGLNFAAEVIPYTDWTFTIMSSGYKVCFSVSDN